MTYPITH